MTLEEMNNLTYGYAVNYTGCSGVSGSAPRVGFPGFCLQDAGDGVRDTDGVSGFASGLSVGASWNSTLSYERAKYMGAEFKRKGVNVALGPVVGPIGRVAENGRNWEGFAADPYADGILGAQAVRGLQESVIASVKHYVAYEQETNRNPISGGVTPSTSANLDDQTLHEVYAWPFQDLIAAGAGCVMCSYNRINNTYACSNSKTLNGVLKGEMNFQGFVLSDWGGQHDSLPSANAGLDMAMPSSTYWDNGQLARAISNGTFNKTRLTDMATRIVATWYQFGQDDPAYPKLGVGMPYNLLAEHEFVDARDPASKQSILDQAVEGHVLVKNNNSALPLKAPKILSIFGYDAIQQTVYDPAPQTIAGQSLDTFALNWQGVSFSLPQLIALGTNNIVLNAPESFAGTLTVGGGSGSNTPSYISSPYDAIAERARANGTQIFYDFTNNNPNVVTSSSACLVFINEYASEAFDRPGLADPKSDTLVTNVASKCNNTIVVIHNAGVRLVDAFADNPNVTAIIFAHLPGQDAGTAIASILYGDVSPSGRLPYTVGKASADYGNLLAPCNATDPLSPQCDFTEGVEIDYRSFLARNVTPRYAFGYGLTYSSFNYSALSIAVTVPSSNGSATGNAPVYTNGTTEQNNSTASIGVAGLNSLFDVVGTVTASITNTGTAAAAEVGQLYLTIPGAKTRALRGFQKASVAPGASAQLSFPLRRKDVSRWDTVKQAWVVPTGTFEVAVGASVLDLPLTGTFAAS